MHRCNWYSSHVASSALSVHYSFSLLWFCMEPSTPIRRVTVPLKLHFKKLPSPVMKVYPKESFHQIKLTKPSSKSSRVCCLGGSAEFSSAMERTQYTVLPKTADVMILWGPKFLRRNTIPLRNLCALKGGKHLMPLKHYHFLGMKLQIKIPYSRKFSLAGSGWKTWHKENHFLKNQLRTFLNFCLHWSWPNCKVWGQGPQDCPNCWYQLQVQGGSQTTLSFENSIKGLTELTKAIKLRTMAHYGKCYRESAKRRETQDKVWEGSQCQVPTASRRDSPPGISVCDKCRAASARDAHPISVSRVSLGPRRISWPDCSCGWLQSLALGWYHMA